MISDRYLAMGNRFKSLDRPLSRRLFLKGALGVCGVAALGIGKGYSNTFSSQIRLERVPIHLKRLPDSFRGMKIVQLSDLHSSPLVGREHLEHAVDLALSDQPDLIVLTGDFIGHTLKTEPHETHEFDSAYLENLVLALRRLKAPMGTFAVLGNHDFWSGAKVTRRLVRELDKRAGVSMLRNRSVTLRMGSESIRLLGIDDYWHSWDLLKAMRKMPLNAVKILLSHNPDINRNIMPVHQIDLVLSGHTHGGQIKLPIVGTPFHSTRDRRYIKGLVPDQERQTYITRGVGHLVVPIRFNCPPEVTSITLT